MSALLGCVLGCALCVCVGAEACECVCERRACVDETMLRKHLSNTSGGRTTDTDSRILLDQASYNRIRPDKKLHACVLINILDFYSTVLKQEVRLSDLAHFLERVKLCVRQNRHFCSELKNEGGSLYSNQTDTRELVLLQIHKLRQAKQQLSDPRVYTKSLVELERLDAYLTGAGFRKYKRKQP